jgi:hypothetical protein
MTIYITQAAIYIPTKYLVFWVAQSPKSDHRSALAWPTSGKKSTEISFYELANK